MMNLQNILIDYNLFEKYDKDAFTKNLVVPIKEDEMTLKLAVSKESNLIDFHLDTQKIIKYQEYSINEIRFILSNFDKKIKLYNLCLDCLKDLQKNLSLKSFFEEMIYFALLLRSSDIHIEQSENEILFRFRVDGRLKTFFVFSSKLFSPLSSYIKLISNLDITQSRIPLDGRFSLFLYDKNYDFRVSTMPTLNSESIVLRILDKKNLNKDLTTLGYSNESFSLIKESINLTQGLILISGPTGSGKTTTMYSILNELISDDKKIITVEDPIEYKIDFISQIAVDNKIGLSFQLILKNILRQDPDIIFIGEIRDNFSLDIALQASLTGHLVIATIHANSAIETISRLIDLKADPYLLSSSLKYVISQRLVLKYCLNCSLNGCQNCNFTTFQGRTTISEVLKIDEEISSMIFKKKQIKLIKEYLKRVNFKTLLDDGKQKVQDNITSMQEVLRAISI